MKPYSLDTHTHALIKLIKRIAPIAAQHSRRYCISGGFCVDFSFGAVTRPHDDVDLIVDVKDTEWWSETIKGLGYSLGRYEYMAYFPNAFTVHANPAERFLAEVWPMEFRPNGTLYPPHTRDHPGREWWRGKLHTNINQVQFEEVSIMVESPHAAIDQKLDHLRHRGEVLAPKHLHDIALMGRLEEYLSLVKRLGLDKP